MPSKPGTSRFRPGDHRLLIRLTPAEERVLSRAYPEIAASPPALRPKRQRRKKKPPSS